jgi:hypothetical protein
MLGAPATAPNLRSVRAPNRQARRSWALLEIGRALARRGLTSAPPATLPVPETVSGLVAERLGDLPPTVLDAVRLVAVMPDAPTAQYLAAGAGEADLDAAALAGVLEPESGRLRFSHPLLASAVAASTPPGRLRKLHLVAARHVPLAEARVRHRALAADAPSASVALELFEAAGERGCGPSEPGPNRRGSAAAPRARAN